MSDRVVNIVVSVPDEEQLQLLRDLHAQVGRISDHVNHLLQGQQAMATDLERMQAANGRISADVGRISTDVAAIKAKLETAANTGGLSATQAKDLADNLETAVTSLDAATDALDQAAAPTATTGDTSGTGGETQIPPA